MVDKAAKPLKHPKGRKYCDTPGTSCFYGPGDVCVNCGRRKGWRQKSRSVMICHRCEKVFKEGEEVEVTIRHTMVNGELKQSDAELIVHDEGCDLDDDEALEDDLAAIGQEER